MFRKTPLDHECPSCGAHGRQRLSDEESGHCALNDERHEEPDAWRRVELDAVTLPLSIGRVGVSAPPLAHRSRLGTAWV